MTGIELIKKWEGCRLHAYLDGGGVPTIGYGHTKGVKLGDDISQEQADTLLQEDYDVAKNAIEHLVTVYLNQNQMGALVCFVFNVGVTAFKNSTMLKMLNMGKFAEASNQFARWNKDNGQVIVGLSNRRAAEKQLFNTVE